MNATRIDFMLSIGFAEEEARFLAGLVQTACEGETLTPMQRTLATRIAGKFLLASEAMKRELVEAHGFDAVVDAADKALADWPDVDEVAL